MIEVETLAGAIRVTIPRKEIDPARVEEMLSWLRRASVTRRSTLAETEAEAMAEAAKADWWARNKVRFVAEAQP